MDYVYVSLPSGHEMVYSVKEINGQTVKKINAHCKIVTHQMTEFHQPCKCHMDRSINDAVMTRGRPIGLLALWLKLAHGIEGKEEHSSLKKCFKGADSQEDRRIARKELWDLRHTVAGIEDLFALEAKVEAHVLLEANTEQPLYEPPRVL